MDIGNRLPLPRVSGPLAGRGPRVPLTLGVPRAPVQDLLRPPAIAKRYRPAGTGEVEGIQLPELVGREVAPLTVSPAGAADIRGGGLPSFIDVSDRARDPQARQRVGEVVAAAGPVLGGPLRARLVVSPGHLGPAMDRQADLQGRGAHGQVHPLAVKGPGALMLVLRVPEMQHRGTLIPDLVVIHDEHHGGSRLAYARLVADQGEPAGVQ